MISRFSVAGLQRRSAVVLKPSRSYCRGKAFSASVTSEYWILGFLQHKILFRTIATLSARWRRVQRSRVLLLHPRKISSRCGSIGYQTTIPPWSSHLRKVRNKPFERWRCRTISPTVTWFHRWTIYLPCHYQRIQAPQFASHPLPILAISNVYTCSSSNNSVNNSTSEWFQTLATWTSICSRLPTIRTDDNYFYLSMTSVLREFSLWSLEWGMRCVECSKDWSSKPL